MKTLGLPKSSIKKTNIVKDRDGNKSGTKRNRHVYGMCTVTINRTDIVQHIFGAIQEIADFNCPEWLYKI